MGGGETPGEKAFEAYLASVGLTAEHEGDFPGRKTKRPDYPLLVDGQWLLCEVKDIDPKDIGSSFVRAAVPMEIRSEINAAKDKFREYGKYACILVLYDRSGIASADHPPSVFSAMHGDPEMTFGFHEATGTLRPETFQLGFTTGGRMTPTTSDGKSYKQNGRISAVVTLRRVLHVDTAFLSARVGLPPARMRDVPLESLDLRFGVMAFENRDARRPLPRSMFRGPCDERWALGDQGLERVFVGESILFRESL